VLKHSHKWIKSLTESLDSQCKPELRAKILESCGRNCIPRSFIKRAQILKKESKDMNDFLEKLGKKWKHMQRDNDNVYIVYEKCYCPLVKDYPEKLSPTWCNCSRGWIKELFESALERPVEVKLEKSIKQGDSLCKFELLL